MSIDLANDPRATLVRTKYFSLRPKPLERWLWAQGLPQTAERVFWLHWEVGMRNGDWCSEIPIKRVACECSVDPSTVTRAYQWLKTKGLIRRQDPGRDEANPFQQATAITEVRLPREFLTELGRTPNRVPARQPTPAAPREPDEAPSRAEQTTAQSTVDTAVKRAAPNTPNVKVRPSREETVAMWNRASAGEKNRFYLATRDRAISMTFDSNSMLTATEQDHIVHQLRQTANARPVASSAAPARAANPQPRRLSALEIAQTRSRLLKSPGGDSPDLLRQIVWAVEEGALSRFAPPLAINIALKKVREGAWTKPHRMPPDWGGKRRPAAAVHETCGAA